MSVSQNPQIGGGLQDEIRKECDAEGRWNAQKHYGLIDNVSIAVWLKCGEFHPMTGVTEHLHTRKRSGYG